MRKKWNFYNKEGKIIYIIFCKQQNRKFIGQNGKCSLNMN